ncbi:MAG: hypothetical protein VCC36_07190 [Gammaproteobacteria bacterium]
MNHPEAYEVDDRWRVRVAGALSVTRTRDGGNSFENLRSGLPQSHAYDLTYRHGLAISGSGEELALGTTTGNCWLSEDQGDSWSQITGTLPPIYLPAISLAKIRGRST